MAPSFSATPQYADESNEVQKMGFFALVAFLYFFNSRVLDVSSIYYLHLPLILGVLAGGFALFAGALFRAFRTRVGICYLALTCWFAAGVPFAFWRGGSADALKGWLRTLVIWAFLVGLTVTYRECKLVLNTLAFAAGTAALLGLTGGSQAALGRLGLERGRLGNPNYFALSLLVALPFVWRLYWSGGRPGILRRLLAAGAGGLIVIAFMKSGSRAGLYAVGVMILMVFLRVRLIQKVQTAMAVGIALAIIFMALPGYLRERYFTFSSTEGEVYASDFEAQLAGQAAGSTLQREHLFRESVSITLRHPLFGVGLGNFAPYVFKWNQDMGRAKEPYIGTHNSYTQMSSEAGIPALLIFLVIIVMSWRALTRLIRATRNDVRPEAKDIHATAQATQVCLAALCFSLLFIHMAYDMLPHMFLGMALAVSSTGERELRDLNAEQLPPMAGKDRGDREILFSGGSLAPQISRTVEGRAAVREMTAEGRRTATARAGSPRRI